MDEEPNESDKEFSNWLKRTYKDILDVNYSNYSDVAMLLSSLKDNNNSIKLKTIYPGLVCGIGYEHELDFKNELKLGFAFDHTTGLPYIPGSSVKGKLRSAFAHTEYLKSILTDWIENQINPWSTREKNKKEKIINDLSALIIKVDWRKLEEHIFEGINYMTQKKVSTYKTDVFFDAFLDEDNTNKSFLADDYITCHQNEKHPELSPFTNPNPVRFLKVRSDIVFQFQFRLFNTPINEDLIFLAEYKKELFKQILLDLGIGAKTNVGYGQFIN
jgi:CRISPR-associated protein Cmr6